MMVNILSKKRPIIEVSINGKKHYALIDTGASVSIVDLSIEKTNRVYSSNVIGAGGGLLELYYPKKSIVDIMGIRLTNFVLGDISDIMESIRISTGYKISMIIGVPDISSLEMRIDIYNGCVLFGE